MIDAADLPLPIDIPEATTHPEQEPDPMSALPTGSTLSSVPDLAGRWSVWSQSDESPGAHFLVPLDDEARATGVKYAVVRATVPKGTAKPVLKLLRTDPQIKG